MEFITLHDDVLTRSLPYIGIFDPINITLAYWTGINGVGGIAGPAHPDMSAGYEEDVVDISTISVRFAEAIGVLGMLSEVLDLLIKMPVSNSDVCTDHNNLVHLGLCCSDGCLLEGFDLDELG